MSIERTAAGFQMVIPGCEKRSLPKSTTRSDDSGQGLMAFYEPPSLVETMTHRANAPLQPRARQKAPPKTGLFG
jgi:hypothetical protein